ncbi:MAG: hypothetical protein QXR26_04865 [Candidatus Caldarchaeum sp.]
MAEEAVQKDMVIKDGLNIFLRSHTVDATAYSMANALTSAAGLSSSDGFFNKTVTIITLSHLKQKLIS